MIALIIALLLLGATVSVNAQKIENELCWFDNSSGQFKDMSKRYMDESIQPFCMYVVNKDHRMPYDASAIRNASAPSMTPSYEAGVFVYVLPGKRMEELKHMERMVIDPVWQAVHELADDVTEGRKKGGGELFTFPMGDADQMCITGKEETVTFMGVNDAKKTDYTVDLGKSPFFLSIFNAQAMQVRLHIYRYYDPTADKSVLAVFEQGGLDREYVPDNELTAVAALFGELSSLLIMMNPANGQALKDWIRNSTWKDMQPDFERYFHLKPALGGGTITEKIPPIDVPNDSTILIGGKGGEVVRKLYPKPVDPELGIVKDPQPYDPKDPEDPGQRIMWPKVNNLTNGGFYVTENDTATYLISSVQSVVYGINKQTGSMTLDTVMQLTPVYMLAGAGCTKDGRLLIYRSKTGVIDVFNHKVIFPSTRNADVRCMVVNPITDRVYIWEKRTLKEYDSHMKELKTYTMPLEDKVITGVIVGKDGRLWIELGIGFSREGYLTLMNGKLTDLVQPEYSLKTPLIGPYLNGTCLGVRKGLHQVPVTGEPKHILPAEWRNLQAAGVNSKGDLFVMHDNFTFERYTTKGEVKLAETYTKDLRFGKKSRMMYQLMYIDRLDNIWICNGSDVFVWHPSGKLNGYGDFNGKITLGME